MPRKDSGLLSDKNLKIQKFTRRDCFFLTFVRTENVITAMKEIKLDIRIRALSYNELSEEDRRLTDLAKEATRRSYSPYSGFSVGAAALLANGATVTGSNQENAAYPSGICAERTTLFYANSQYPDQAVKTLAIAARTVSGFIDTPIPPCGACRQVLLETEQRYHQPIRILLYGEKEIYQIDGVKDLLPLSFGGDFLSK